MKGRQLKYEITKLDGNGIIKRFDDIKNQLVNNNYSSSGIYLRISQQETFLKKQIPELIRYVNRSKFIYSILSYFLILIIGIAFIYVSATFFNDVAISLEPIDAIDKLQSIDSVFSIIIAGVVSIGGIMLWSNEQAHKKTNKLLKELRAFIHIIDMHQLAKPKEAIGELNNGTVIASPNQRKVYLSSIRDSILMSGKIAALIYQISSDNRSKTEVAEIEQLCESIALRILTKHN